MSQFKDHFSTASDDYRAYRPQYPAELFDYLAALAPSREHAWDCGCGNGQASVALAERFKRVTASDASGAQIAQAEARDNISYRISPAEEIAAADESLDLVTVAQAIHWFDHPRFFAEVTRVLKPRGVLAAWGYQLLNTDTPLDEFIVQFHGEVVGPYWPAGRELLDEGYTRVDFPFPREQAPTFYMRRQWSFGHLLGYLNTWSAVKAYEKARGRNPVTEHEATLRQYWGNAETRDVYWPLILYVGRKA
ncbi:class I SAM-dependent methyltransferase [Proteobacteria bacterium 005FR1]|nr:class I SAM-dependent methyltransferase [Proteobacteria bacterium 005FR1]